MLEHGGRLLQAALKYRIEPAQWLDLSTGIAPFTLPLPAIDASAWQRLPETEDGLEAAARDYYRAAELLPLAGSQAAIQALPRLRGRSRVGVLSPCYGEHAHAWRRAGHDLVECAEGAIRRALDRLDVLVVVNPNNPTGRLIEVQQLLHWHARLAERGGWLIVDEAFIDCTPEHSLAAESHRPGLIVLRSFGKFFGLAGARLGFALAERDLLTCLQRELGPWTLSGPSRLLGRSLLADVAAQQVQRAALLSAGERLAELLRQHGLAPLGGCALFHWLLHEQAAQLFDFCARRGILLRLYRNPLGLRFGLPGDEAGWQRLDAALLAWNEENP
ncbi:threonine-phosphate decarboxylase CobD [Pseudomonas mangrovi]|uniref:threonine-phosphate decarboxylase n=1 Tax=Pseudomonas mangrovi TaxID=2161748 RepID=A0A2T5PE17_9PSED|nr:threonine-phosphate decarboxylase CobD [Pseudomonas mangrovi]PTU75982.1 threonine-phosphate decarboxylase [Pseudomonas mangrovi]